MASLSVRFTTIILLSLIIFSSFLLFAVSSSSEFEVGGINGWIVPPANDSKFYNDWASEKRFQIGDSIRFKYMKDSVMEVNEGDYNKCNSSRPNFFANTGNTIYNLDRSGYFYFISGASGHCEKGQRMIVKVLSQDQLDTRSGGHGHGTTSSASRFASIFTFQFLLLYLLASSYLCSS
ncbi:hypothetical protein M9H77_37199 [Catharanthus roseus]|uniref:Uncharacterized protein n=1 Tax=Catharanthus roseus TaxID=4058 RepID=A0ACB9ZVU9_CATRO|nr:hypothetical protein M9H77_37199 [Catharanthus roseus]